MGRFLIDTLGEDLAETLINIVDATHLQTALGLSTDAKLALKNVDIESRLSTKQKRARAFACDKAVRAAFGIGILDDIDPTPNTRTIRTSRLVSAHASSNTWLEPVPMIDEGYKPDARFRQWMGEIVAAFDRTEDKHFLYRFPATPHNVMDAFFHHAQRLSFWFGAVSGYDDEPSFMYSSPRTALEMPEASAPGFDALSAAIVPDDCACVKLLPTLDFFRAGTIEGINPNFWSSKEGTARLRSILRNLSLLPRMRGVHIWCCPSYCRLGLSSTDFEECEPLPSMDFFAGRQAIYEPLILDLQTVIPVSDDPRFEDWYNSFETLSKFAWGPSNLG